MAGSLEIKVPDLGGFADVAVIDVLVKVGDTVAVDTPLITLETEKATIDVPSTAAGRVTSIQVKKGSKVSQGSVIVTLEGESKTASPGAAASPTSPASSRPATASATGTAASAAHSASPSSKSAAPSAQSKSAASASTGAILDIKIPDLGGFAEVGVIDVLVKEGDTVDIDTPLITLETEKATMDVPSTAAGRVTSVKVKKGAKVSQGSVILTLQSQGGGTSAAAASPAQSTANAAAGIDATVRHTALQVPPPASVGQISEGARSAHASPSIRKFARELGVDLARVQGSGLKGRITQDDIKAFVKQIMTGGGAAAASAGAALPKVPAVDFAKFGPIETKPLNRIQKISGPRLHASWVNIPHVTQFDEADITDLEEARTKLKAKAIKEGIKLTPLAFIIKACVKALQEFPQFNASLDAAGENLVLKKYLHIGFAADTPNGLMVPVIRDANRKDVYEIARDLGDLSAKARDGKLSAAEMQGGCFTISSLGGIGGTAFTPIINAPEVAILGVSKSDHKPVYRNGGFVPRLILPLSLSYDHRVIDGAQAARFTTFLSQKLADVRSLLEAIP